MNINSIVKALVSSGIAASVVTGIDTNQETGNDKIAEAAPHSEPYYYQYEGSTGFGDGQFLTDDDFIKALKKDGTLNLNGYEIEASEDDFEKYDATEVTEVYDQVMHTADDNTATYAEFPIKDGEITQEDITEAYGDEYIKKGGSTLVYELGDNDNIIAFSIEDNHVTSVSIGFTDLYK